MPDGQIPTNGGRGVKPKWAFGPGYFVGPSAWNISAAQGSHPGRSWIEGEEDR